MREDFLAEALSDLLGLFVAGRVEAEVAARLALDEHVQVGVGLAAARRIRYVRTFRHWCRGQKRFYKAY